MKLKHNLIAGACLASCALSSFAAVTPLVCATPASASSANGQTFAQNCAPQQTLFIGGASTVKGNIGTLVLANIFDTALMTPVKVIDIGTVSGKNGNAIAYYGMSKASLTTTAKRLLVVYNYNNGSAAGVSQLYAKPDATKVPESDAVMVGPLKANTANTACTTSVAVAASAGVNPTIAASTDTVPSVTCTSHAAQQADLAISDVNGNELYALYSAAAAGKFSTLTATPMVLQAFGVVASPMMYSALQAQNIADGLLAAGCTDTTAACQPSIRSADYASLVSKAGTIKSLAALVPAAGSSAVLTLARRDDLSGSQASSNIFFVDGQCGTDNAAGSIAKAGGLLGGLPIISIADAGTYPSLNILSAVVSGDVKNAVSSASDYAIGVLNVGGGGTVAGTGTGLGRFVKIDGQSPNFVAGTQNSVSPMATGNYRFAMTTFALTVTAAMTKSPEKKALTDALIASFKNSNQAQSGLAYFDGAVASKQSLVHRTNGNNCSPLIK